MSRCGLRRRSRASLRKTPRCRRRSRQRIARRAASARRTCGDPDRGAGATWQGTQPRAASMWTTESVIFADADDLMLPGAVRASKGTGRRSSLVAFAMAFHRRGNGGAAPLAASVDRRTRALSDGLAVMNAIWAIYPITGPVLIRTAFAREVGWPCRSRQRRRPLPRRSPRSSVAGSAGASSPAACTTSVRARTWTASAGPLDLAKRTLPVRERLGSTSAVRRG